MINPIDHPLTLSLRIAGFYPKYMDERQDGKILLQDGKEDLCCIVDKDEVLNIHPGSTGYRASHELDWDDPFHITPTELWDSEGTEYKRGMIMGVWENIARTWVDDEMQVIKIQKP